MWTTLPIQQLIPPALNDTAPMPEKSWSLLLLIQRLMHALSSGKFLRCMILSLIFVLTASNLLIASNRQSDDSEGPPNIVLIVADDLGFGDVKCFGNDRCIIPTPFLDRQSSWREPAATQFVRELKIDPRSRQWVTRSMGKYTIRGCGMEACNTNPWENTKVNRRTGTVSIRAAVPP